MHPILLVLLQAAAAPPAPLELAPREARLPLVLLPPGEVINTHLDTIEYEPPSAAGEWIGFLVEEAEQGGIDRNGDGDALDWIATLFDVRHERGYDLGVQTGLPLPSFGPGRMAFAGDGVLLSASESDLGADANGDGDLGDYFVCRRDLRGGALVSTGLAGSCVGALPEGAFLVLTYEGDQERDLNGDGDDRDYVPFVLGPVARPVLAPGGASVAHSTRVLPAVDLTSSIQRHSAGVFFLVSELAEHRLDRNGDGDFGDKVLAVYDPLRRRARNLGLASLTDLRSDGARMVFRVPEFAQEADLNGDGDQGDTVVHLYDASTGTVTNLGIGASLAQVQGEWLSYSVPEADDGVDRNGDGDALDNVLAVQRLGDPVATNLGLAVTATTGGAGQRMLFTVSETFQGADLNADGDTTDNILFSMDTASGVVQNLNAALGRPPQRSERLAVLEVFEYYAGADYNLDGDLDDIALGVYDGALDRFVNLQVAMPPPNPPAPRVVGSRMAATLSELSSSMDLNGDGDQDDRVVVWYDADTGLLTSTGLPSEQFWLFPELLVVPVREYSLGPIDLNGDGDVADEVVHVVRLGG